MSQENVEIARRLYPGPLNLAQTVRDPQATEAFRNQFEHLAHPDFETRVDPASLPVGFHPNAHGPEGFLNIFREWLVAFESWTVTANEFIDVDEDRVLVMCTLAARWEGQRAELETEGGNLYTFRDGKVARVELFLDRRAALTAAGLS